MGDGGCVVRIILFEVLTPELLAERTIWLVLCSVDFRQNVAQAHGTTDLPKFNDRIVF